MVLDALVFDARSPDALVSDVVGSRSRRAPLLSVRALVVLGALVLGALASAGCADRDRRLTEYEALEYRKQLVRGSQGQLSEEQVHRLMYHPARTPREIDSNFEKLQSEFVEQQARDAAAWSESRRAAREAGAGLSEGVGDGDYSPVAGESLGGESLDGESFGGESLDGASDGLR